MFSLRKDYEQFICARDLANDAIKQSLSKLIYDEMDQHDNNNFEQSCLNVISSINWKMYDMQSFGLSIRLQLENLLQFFQLRYLRTLNRHNVKKTNKKKVQPDLKKLNTFKKSIDKIKL